MLIAERILSDDVADYLCFRGVCSDWRRCTDDPQENVLDRRFYPRRWTMLPNVHGRRPRRRYRHSRFKNINTGESIRMTIRGLDGRDGRTFLAPTPEGLLVLLNKKTDEVWVVNPITGAHADLPPVTTLLDDYPWDLVFPRWPRELHLVAALTEENGHSKSEVVISFGALGLLGAASPGDDGWAKLMCYQEI